MLINWLCSTIFSHAQYQCSLTILRVAEWTAKWFPAELDGLKDAFRPAPSPTSPIPT